MQNLIKEIQELYPEIPISQDGAGYRLTFPVVNALGNRISIWIFERDGQPYATDDGDNLWVATQVLNAPKEVIRLIVKMIAGADVDVEDDQIVMPIRAPSNLERFVTAISVATWWTNAKLAEECALARIKEPTRFPFKTLTRILKVARCMLSPSGLALLKKFAVKDWGWGVLENDELLLVIHVDPDRFNELATELKSPGKMSAVFDVGAKFAEELTQICPELDDVPLYVDAVPARE